MQDCEDRLRGWVGISHATAVPQFHRTQISKIKSFMETEFPLNAFKHFVLQRSLICVFFKSHQSIGIL